MYHYHVNDNSEGGHEALLRHGRWRSMNLCVHALVHVTAQGTQKRVLTRGPERDRCKTKSLELLMHVRRLIESCLVYTSTARRKLRGK